MSGDRRIAAASAGAAVGLMAAWAVFAWTATLGTERLQTPGSMAILGTAVGLSAWWSVYRLVTATWHTKAGVCFAIAALALFAHLVIGLSGHVIDLIGVEGGAALGGIGTLVFLSRRLESPMVPALGGTQARAQPPALRFTRVALVSTGAILAGELVSRAIDPGGATAGGVSADSSPFGRLESVFLAPIFEEMCFRGVLLVGLRVYFGIWASASVSSMLFAIFHPGDAPEVAAVVVRSFVWAIAVLKSGSLVPAVAGHAVHNVLGMLGSDS